MDTTHIPTADRPLQPEKGAPPTEDPRDGANGLSPDAPQGARDVARGHKPDGAAELSAVGFMLGQQRAPRYKVRVTFATDGGDKTLWFYVRSMDSKRIDAVENAHVDRAKVTATGAPETDQLGMNAAIVADALITISDGEPGTPAYEELAKIKPDDSEFLKGMASAADALQTRFHWQEGLLAGVAMEVRRISGWAPDRVGQAERVLVDVAGGS
jgi:hypothetical protein